MKQVPMNVKLLLTKQVIPYRVNKPDPPSVIQEVISPRSCSLTSEHTSKQIVGNTEIYLPLLTRQPEWTSLLKNTNEQ